MLLICYLENLSKDVSLCISDILDDCNIFDDQSRRCMIFSDDIYGLALFPYLDPKLENILTTKLGTSCSVADPNVIVLGRMILVDTLPKIHFHTPIMDFLMLEDVYEEEDASLMEDLSLGDILEALDERRKDVKNPSPVDDPVSMLAGEFVAQAQIICHDPLDTLMGMINYQASLVGEVVFKDISSIVSTRLEMESEMQTISTDLHAKFVTELGAHRMEELVLWHDAKSRSFSELSITSILYDNYVSKYVSVLSDGRNASLWIFGSGMWRETSVSQVWRDLSNTFISYIKSSGYNLEDVSRYLGSVATRERIQRDLIQRLCDDKFPSKLNSNPNLIGMKDGVYDIQKDILRPGLPADYISMTTGCRLGLAASIWQRKRKALIKILERVFPDKEILQYFIRSCAGLLEGRNKNKLVYVWWGKGNNGKSMIEKLLHKALGDYATVAATSLITGKRAGADNATPQLSALEGKLVVFLQEPNPNEVIRIGVVKELSGGDTITTRALFRSPRTFVPKFKLVLVCNNVMEIPNIDIAFRNRLVVIPFNSTFVVKDDYAQSKKQNPNTFVMDTSVARNIGDYADVFLRMLVEEYKQIRDIDDPEIPDPIKEATRLYVDWNNSTLSYINEHLVRDPNTDTPLDYVYAEYKQWVRDNSSRKPVDSNVFREEMTGFGFVIKDNRVQSVMVVGHGY